MDHNGLNVNSSRMRFILAGAFVAILSMSALASAQTEPDSDPGGTFFEHFVIAGGKIVYYILIPMSLLTVCRILELCIIIRRKKLVPEDISSQIATMAQKFGIKQLTTKLAEANDLVSTAVHRALVQASRPRADAPYIEHVASDTLHDCAMRLMRKVELCNIIGNVAPMVGLFGTVYGMIQAFGLLGISGGAPRHDQLAAKISIALVTTFWGLLIAIPALTVHGIFRTRIEALVSEAAVEIEAILHQLKPTILPDEQAKETASSFTRTRKRDTLGRYDNKAND